MCYCCGNTGHRAKDVRCPANGKTCRSCGKVSHFSTVCRCRRNRPNSSSNQQAHANQVGEQVVYTDDECVFRVCQLPSLLTTIVALEGLSVRMIIDSGASVNIVDLDTYYEVSVLKEVKIKYSFIYIWFYEPLNIRGTISVWADYNGKLIPANKQSVLRRQSRDTNRNIKRSVYCQYE